MTKHEPGSVGGATIPVTFLISNTSFFMLEVIYNPDSFFQKEKEQRSWRGFAVVIIAAFLSSVNGYIIAAPLSESIYEYMSSRIPAEQARIVANTTYVASTFSPFVIVIINWIVISAVLHAISAIFDGKGKFADTLKLIAYSFVPSIVLFPANLYMSIENAKLIEAYGFEMLKNSEITTASALLSFAALIWQFTLWRFGILHARNLSERSATIVALIPFAVLAAISIYSLINLRGLTP